MPDPKPTARTLVTLALAAAASGCWVDDHEPTPPAPAAPATFLAGAAKADITPPLAGAAAAPADFATCDAKYDGPRQFAFEEPYVDATGAGHYVAGDDFCDANGNMHHDGIYLAGGSGQNRVPAQILDPIGAQAVVIGDAAGAHRVAIVTVDSVGLMELTIGKIAYLAKQMRPGLDEVLVSSTHDESAPDPVGLWGPDQGLSGVDDYYLDYLVQQAVGAVVAAYDAAVPAKIRFARATQPDAFRPIWSSYPFVLDPTLLAMQAVAADDPAKVIFTLANYHFHAEGYGFSPDDTLSHSLSADWPAVTRAHFEARYGGVGVALAGLVGSVETPQVYPKGGVPQVPVAPVMTKPDDDEYSIFAPPADGDMLPHGSKEETQAIGDLVAQAVEDAFAASPDQWSTRGDVKAIVTPVCFAVENQFFLQAFQIGLVKRRGCGDGAANTASAVAVANLGDAQMAFLPGEVFPHTIARGFLGPDDMPFPDQPMTAWVGAAMTRPYTFFAGLGEDGAGYIQAPGNFVGFEGEILEEPWASWEAKSEEYDRLGFGHGDDGEALGPNAGVVMCDALMETIQQVDPAGGADRMVAVGRFVDAEGRLSRSPFAGGDFSGAVGVVVLPEGSTDFEGGAGTVYATADHATVGGRSAEAIGGFVDLHGLPEAGGYTVATRGVWLKDGKGGVGKRIFVDVYPGN